jgi:hypothetical protein
MPLAVNADSLSTWFLPPLTRLAERHPVVFDLHRDDQDFTAALLESGTVTGAVTSRAHPVAGCRVVPLGELVYEAVATPAFRDRWLDTAASDAAAACATRRSSTSIDATTCRRRWLRARGVDPAEPPRHRVPASHDFAAAVQLGLGWALLPRLQSQQALDAGTLVPLEGAPVRVPLYWQQWNLRSELLDAVAEEIVAEGAGARPGGPIRSAVADREHDLPRVWPRSISRCAASASARSKTRSTKTRIAPESSRRARVASTLPSGTTLYDVARTGRLRGIRVVRPRAGGHEDVQPAGAQDRQRSCSGVVVDVADEVDHDVDRADDVLEACRGVVDDDRGAELAQPGQVAADPVAITCAEVRRELHGEVAHSAATGVDEYPLALVGVRGLDHQTPRRQRCQRNGGRLDVRERGGLAGDGQSGNDGVVGVRAGGAGKAVIPNTSVPGGSGCDSYGVETTTPLKSKPRLWGARRGRRTRRRRSGSWRRSD